MTPMRLQVYYLLHFKRVPIWGREVKEEAGGPCAPRARIPAAVQEFHGDGGGAMRM